MGLDVGRLFSLLMCEKASHQAAANRQNDAIHIAGLVAQEESANVSDLARPTNPSHRNAVLHDVAGSPSVTKGVSMTAGAIVFTRTFLLPHSMASTFVSPATPAL